MPDTKTLKNALKDSMPDVYDDAKAEQAVKVVFSKIKEELNKGNTFVLHGVGEFRTDPEDGGRKVLFTPDRILIDRINEADSPPSASDRR